MTGLEITRCSIVYTKQIFNDWFFPTFLAVVLSILHMRSKSNLLIKHFSKQSERLQKNKATLSFVAVSGSGIRDKHPGSATLSATLEEY
jgi:hypothetical protein